MLDSTADVVVKRSRYEGNDDTDGQESEEVLFLLT